MGKARDLNLNRSLVRYRKVPGPFTFFADISFWKSKSPWAEKSKTIFQKRRVKMKASMKTLGIIFLAIALVFTFSATSVASEQKAVTLKFAKAGPPTGAKSLMDKWFTEEITRRTNGKVKFEIFWSGTLLKSRENLKGIGRGVADAGEGSGLFAANEYPHRDEQQ